MKAASLLLGSTLLSAGIFAAQQGETKFTEPLAGHVSEYKTGRPIAALKITAAVPGPDGRTPTQEVTTVTDSKGLFKFKDMPKGNLFLLYNAGGNSCMMGAQAGDESVEIRIRDSSFHIVQVGEQVPEMNLKVWLNSKPLDNAALKGKPVVLDFWGVTCPPCVAALPSLEALSKKYEGKALVIGVHECYAIDARKLKTFAQKHNVTYPLAIDHGGDCGFFYDRFISQGSPTIAVLDKDGKIVQINGTVADADAKLQELLSQK